MKAQHQINQESVVEDHTKMAVADILTKGVIGWKKSAKKAMQDWVEQSLKNEEAEKVLHDRLRAKTPRGARSSKTRTSLPLNKC